MSGSALESAVVFCGSRSGKHPINMVCAANLGKLLANQGIKLIYGGGESGLMGVVATSVISNGGKVVAVTPKGLHTKPYLSFQPTEVYLVENMHQRKQRMYELADGALALPGGFGTYEEVLEFVTWTHLYSLVDPVHRNNFHNKPASLINFNGYFDGLLQGLDRAVEDGFLLPEERQLLMSAPEPLAALEQLTQWINQNQNQVQPA